MTIQLSLPASGAARFGQACLLAAMMGSALAPAARAGNVTVINPLTKPVPVTDTDNPAQQPVAFTLSPSSSTSNSAQATYTVPAGKRLVIEYYSAQLTQYPSGGYGYVYLIPTTSGIQNYFKIIPPISNTLPINQVTRMYADPGSVLYAQVVDSSGSSCGAAVIISGYLVNVP